MNRLIFITGGARSGKSSFSEKIAEELYNYYKNGQKIAYIATGVPLDKEFKERISIHKKRRGNIFETYEEDIYIDKQINKILHKHKIFLIECLTTWLGNLFQIKESNIHKEVDNIIDNILKIIGNKKNQKSIPDNLIINLIKSEKKKLKYTLKSLLKLKKEDKILILVSNETGMGIVPDNKISRDFRDLLGKINQKIANHAHFIYFAFSGIPIRIK